MEEDSESCSYWKKRIVERGILELKDEIAESERTVEILDDTEELMEAEEEQETLFEGCVLLGTS